MKIEYSSAFRRDRKRCKKRHWDLDFLDSIVASYVTNNGFTDEEIIKYHDHSLKGEWKEHREFHPYGRHHDWIVVYHIEGNKLVLDATGDQSTFVLDRTGSHDEIFGEDLL